MTGTSRVARAATGGTGAPPAEDGDWHLIDWVPITADVTRLQVRIAKATPAGTWNKVQALQRLLTRSRSGMLSAVKRVTEKLTLLRQARSDYGLQVGLSRVLGNSHARF